MEVLSVRNLKKTYPSFTLDQVSFSLQPGTITGFIGRNGAGKSTTLNSLFHFVHPDSGEITFFGLAFAEHEMETVSYTHLLGRQFNRICHNETPFFSDKQIHANGQFSPKKRQQLSDKIARYLI